MKFRRTFIYTNFISIHWIHTARVNLLTLNIYTYIYLNHWEIIELTVSELSADLVCLYQDVEENWNYTLASWEVKNQVDKKK